MEAINESSRENNCSLSLGSKVEKGKEVTTNPIIDPGEEEGDVIHRKDQEVRELIRWKVDRSKKHFYDGLQPA